MNLRILYLLLLFITPMHSFSQASYWHYLPNSDLDNGNRRIEDVYFTNFTKGFAVTLDRKIYKTNDGGLSWQIKNDTTQGDGFRAIEFLDDGMTGIAGSLNDTGRMYRTTDGGETWINISQNINDPGPKAKRICGLSHFGNTFYAVGWWGATNAKFYKSTDKGLTWTTTVIDTGLATNLVDVVFVSPDTGFAAGGKSTLTSPLSSNESVVLKTTNGGQTWTKTFSDSSIGGKIWKIQAVDKHLLVGSIEPFFNDTVAMVRSADGGINWSIIGTGFYENTSSIGTQGIGFANAQKGWIGGYYEGLIQTIDGGQTWDTVSFGKDFNRFFVIDSNHVYAGGGSVYRYGDSANFTVNIPQVPSRLPHDLYPLSPNPSTGKVKIEFELRTTTNVVLEVANIDTKRVFQLDNTRLTPGKYVYYWDGTKEPNGTYMIWLGTDEIPIVQKFILNK